MIGILIIVNLIGLFISADIVRNAVNKQFLVFGMIFAVLNFIALLVNVSNL